jgi:hypothetical protein
MQILGEYFVVRWFDGCERTIQGSLCCSTFGDIGFCWLCFGGRFCGWLFVLYIFFSQGVSSVI